MFDNMFTNHKTNSFECVDNMLMSQFYKNFNESDEKFVDVDKTCEGLNL